MTTPLPPSAAIYGRVMLSIYDVYVLGFSNRFVWNCPTSRILDLYQRCVSANHLDIGVGTGYFLDHVTFPSNQPVIHLMDINPVVLDRTAERIQRLRPYSIFADVNEAHEILGSTQYDSIALNYLLHCLPGTITEKGGPLFTQLQRFLKPSGGRLFGSTILGQGVRHNFVGQRLMRLYNKKGIFGNQFDSEDQLRHLLGQHFQRYELEVRGCVALFIGYR
jgi:ubiquinone/menaquinone biosynthesis C-methylase UbiE